MLLVHGDPLVTADGEPAALQVRQIEEAYSYVLNNPRTYADAFGLVIKWNYELPRHFTRRDYHRQRACNSTDTCDSAIAKLQAWITNGAIRSNHLYGYLVEALYNGSLTPQQYLDHMKQLRNTNRQIINCWVIVKEKCKCEGRKVPPRPYVFKVPERIPSIPRQSLPWWVPNNPKNDKYQDVGIGVFIAAAVVTGAWAVGALGGGGAAVTAGGAGGGGAAGASAPVILTLPQTQAAAAAAAGVLLIPFEE